MIHSNTRRRLVPLLAVLGPLMGCAPAERDSSVAKGGPDASVATRQSPSIVASAVCDSVAVRWTSANVPVARADSVTEVGSVIGLVSACVVTAVTEDGDSMIVRRRSYWADSTANGWQGITRWDADGPDGESRTVIRSGVRCQVDGEWDGGDDSNPTAERSQRVTERTTCWGDPAGLTPRDTSIMP